MKSLERGMPDPAHQSPHRVGNLSDEIQSPTLARLRKERVPPRRLRLGHRPASWIHRVKEFQLHIFSFFPVKASEH